MVVRNSVNGIKESKVIFVWYIVSVPCHHIERGKVLFGWKELSLVLQSNIKSCSFIYSFIFRYKIVNKRNIINIFEHTLVILVKSRSLSSKAATGCMKSRGLASPLAPMGPRSGILKWAPNTSNICWMSQKNIVFLNYYYCIQKYCFLMIRNLLKAQITLH